MMKILAGTAIALLMILSSVGCGSQRTEPDLVQDFSLRDISNNNISLFDLLETKKSVTVIFFRGHF